MTTTFTVEQPVQFQRRRHGRKQLQTPAQAPSVETSGRVPRLARLMALAIRLEGLVRSGVIRDYAALARLGHVTRARISQIQNLVLLAPDIQEEILFLTRPERGRSPVHLSQMQPIAALADWKKQRRRWRELLRQACPD